MEQKIEKLRNILIQLEVEQLEILAKLTNVNESYVQVRSKNREEYKNHIADLVRNKIVSEMKEFKIIYGETRCETCNRLVGQYGECDFCYTKEFEKEKFDAKIHGEEWFSTPGICDWCDEDERQAGLCTLHWREVYEL